MSNQDDDIFVWEIHWHFLQNYYKLKECKYNITRKIKSGGQTGHMSDFFADP